MGVEDNTGTDTRTETTDKPTSRERPYTPPPDNPGSPGQPSRRESIARARQAQLENGSSQPSQSSDTSPKPAQDRDDKPVPPQTDDQNGKPETPGTTETEDKEYDHDEGKPRTGQGGRPDGREEEPRPQDSGIPASEPSPGTPAARDRSQAQARLSEQRPDTHTDTADKPASAERQWTPPPDNPGSPGQPSRRESIARAREAQQENASQQPEGTNTGSAPTEEHADQPTSVQPEDNGLDTPAAGKAEAAGSDEAGRQVTDEGSPESGQATAQDESGAQTHPRDAGTPASSAVGTDAPSDLATDEPEPRERAAEPPRDSEQNTRIADGPPDDGQPMDQTENRPDAEQRTVPETSEPAADASARDGEPANRRITENAPHPIETADEKPRTEKTFGEQNFDRDTKAKELGTDEAYSRNPESTAQPIGYPKEASREEKAGEGANESDQQRALGKELAELADKKVDVEIDDALDKVNPKYDQNKSAYTENCTGVVQAHELRRRGSDVEAGPLEKHLRTDQRGPGGRPLSVIEQAWGGKFIPATKPEIEEAFKQPGSRGIVYIAWNGVGGGAHVLGVENVGGNVRFVDGQPTPPLRDASQYFTAGRNTSYLRVDDRPTPADNVIKGFLEP